jgi:hypothetical protein
MTGRTESAAAWASASPAARVNALAAHVDALGNVPFSITTLAKMDALGELLAAAPGAPVEDEKFLRALTAEPLYPLATERMAGPRITAPPISETELNTARATPDCIVERMFYADVGCLIAPGGIGKTTLMTHVSTCIALGRQVFGEPVHKPGSVLILTAEDSRQILVARLRACMDAMGLTDAERATVCNSVRIADVSGLGVRLTDDVGGMVLPSETTLDGLLALARDINPVLIVIDPAVSFGVGESRVNDAEQGLIEAARRLRNALNCCVLYVHHSGKANARERTLDQYSGRGGSAFADGSRMVLVLQNLPPEEFEKATGQTLADGETGMILARPKMSYCPPAGDIFIHRSGFAFNRVEVFQTTKAARVQATADQVFNLLRHEMKEGRRHTKNTLEHADAGSLKRADIRAALARLEADGRIEFRDGPRGEKKRGPQKYLHPVESSPKQPGEVIAISPKKEAVTSPDEIQINFAAAYREIHSAARFPPSCVSPFPHFAKFTRRGFGEVGEVCHLADSPTANPDRPGVA